MAYKTTVSKPCTTRDQGLAELWSQLNAMGWTVVDGNFTAITVDYTAVNTTDNTFTTTSGSVPQNATPCQITSTGSIPGSLAINTQYYVVNRTDTTFKLSTTYNGSAIDITSQGTGNHTIKEAYRVYSSNGEDSDRIPEFMKIYFIVANTVSFQAYYGYNVSTKVFVGMGRDPGGITTNESAYYLSIYGNKNQVHVLTRISTSYTRVIFGHWIPLKKLTATLTSGISSGSNVVVPVNSTSGFEPGYNYQIVGASQEGRYDALVTTISGANALIVSSVSTNFASGAQIGIHPSYFGNTAVANNHWMFTSPYAIVGTADVSQPWGNGNFYNLIPATSSMEGGQNRAILTPVFGIRENQQYPNGVYYSSDFGPGHILENFCMFGPSSSTTGGFANEDTATVMQLDAGTSSGSNSSSTLNDTTKSWAVNTFAGKVIVIIFSTGAGQICKIESNTATELTLNSNYTFITIPDATSQYIICERAYRCVYDAICPATDTVFAMREGV